MEIIESFSQQVGFKVSFIEHLKIQTPVLWVNTPDPYRYQELVALVSPNSVYVMDPMKGFCVWNRQAKCFRPVLMDLVDMDGSSYQGSCFSLPMALGYVLNNGGTFLIHFAHKSKDDLLGVFGAVVQRYRETFYTDDANTLPAQLICFSYGEDLPPDVSHLVQYIDPGVPTVEELVEICGIIEANAGATLKEPVDAPAVAAAGVGLTESDFISTCLLSARKFLFVDPVFVNKTKMDQIKMSGNLEIRKPKISLDDIGGLDKAKELIRHISWMWEHQDEAKAMNLVPLRRILLVGVPGSGKSAICEAIASTLDLDLAKTGISQNINKFIGQSEENMRKSFAMLKALAPIVAWVDEAGRDLSQGHWQGDGGTTSRMHGEFLTGMQELPDNVLFVGAANLIEQVAPEMLRADRFDCIMFVGFPTHSERKEIFKIHLGDVFEDFDLDSLAEMTESYTGAEIKALVAETRFRVSMTDHRMIITDDVLAQIPMQKNRMWLRYRSQILTMYDKALIEWDWASTEQQEQAPLVLQEKFGIGPKNPTRRSARAF